MTGAQIEHVALAVAMLCMRHKTMHVPFRCHYPLYEQACIRAMSTLLKRLLRPRYPSLVHVCDMIAKYCPAPLPYFNLQVSHLVAALAKGQLTFP